MNPRFLSLALAGALSLSLLAGCGSNGESVAPSEEVTPPQASESVQPSESPLPSESLQPEVSEEPSASVTPSDEPETPSAKPTSKPSAAPTTKPTAKPTAKPTTKPTAKPTPTPAPTQAPADASTVINSVWTEISKNEMPALIDLDSETLLAVYSINSSDLEAYICKMPMMATHATEFFIAKVKDGKMDTVKAAVEKRQDDLEAQWSQYLPEQLELVQNYKLVTNGNYILFAISDSADAAVTAFNTYTK
ncbi:hypothetical protein B5G43_06005 [Flavonifractor sp. An92]|uniref:DUF4358 domain-containing protein n=1 Tax=Flavonifractor sp. An92 TaxID=1965666 RepID=UPI000B3676E7|nr:DUF4358 domain-containing protein [Flavonifractor sp. An92]OUN07156.1 hypothetical protein B5G43_06005 [Flavonifractor sp. An92]